MSGTSLDGLDIAYCQFKRTANKWTYQILESEVVEYDKDLKDKLSNSVNLSGLELTKLSNDLGYFFGTKVKEFCKINKINPLLIASHGHTVFHQPENGFTLQIGNGANIATKAGIDTVCDFRTVDVALGGQGAPLVPIGDELLFSEYKYCLNIGGIANISTNHNGQRIAWDICPANMLLNHYSKILGYDYDKDAMFSNKGKIEPKLLNELISISYHKQKPPKSLGYEYVFAQYIPIIDKYNCSIENKMATIVKFIAVMIKEAYDNFGSGKVLISGGGAFHPLLIKSLKEKNINIYIPDNKTIAFKEALIFAFLGLLRKLEETNTLKSVTGAERDSIGGVIYLSK